MDSKTFFDNFETIANAPGGIARLRELILDLAVRGKLSERHGADQPITTLVSALQSELVPYGEMSEFRFDIPDHWVWIPLASVVKHQLGKMLNTSKMKGIQRPYLRSVNVRQDGNIDLADVKKMLIPESELLKYDVRIGDIFVNEGGDVGRNAIWQIQSDQEFAFQNQLHRLRPVCGVESRYVQFVLRHAKSSGVIAAMSSGVTIQHFSASAIRKLAFPLPPVEEQKRIVTKVDELMALCDELEATQDQRNAIRTAARKSAIDAISIATTPEELDVAWKRISENWLTIADTPESIASLRSLILDMFLGNVFENGQSVKTVKLGDVVRTLNGDRSSNYPSKEHRVKSGIPFINAGHLVNGKIVLTDMDYITPQKYESLSGGKIMLNDVLFCLRGSLGKCALNNEILHGTVASSLTILRPNENLDANYLLRFLQSGLCGGQIKKYDNGTAQPNLSAKNLTKFELQVPGVEEQKRIVAKVDQLMALCDQLENSLLGRVELGKKVAAAITAEVAA